MSIAVGINMEFIRCEDKPFEAGVQRAAESRAEVVHVRRQRRLEHELARTGGDDANAHREREGNFLVEVGLELCGSQAGGNGIAHVAPL